MIFIFTAILILATAVGTLRTRIKKIQQLKKYAARFENIYVLSISPSGDEPQLGFLKEFCVFAPHKHVLRTAKEQRQLLEDAENEFLSEEIKASARMRVITIIFRDGHPNESWEEFEDRAAQEIKVDRETKHQMLRENIEFYNTYHNRQVA